MRADGVRFQEPMVNPWERGIAPAETHAAAPVRHIKITPEILADEARKQLEREAAVTSSWGIRSSLSVENLKREPKTRPGQRKSPAQARRESDKRMEAAFAQIEAERRLPVVTFEVTTPEPKPVRILPAATIS